jgi:hypothetical protein
MAIERDKFLAEAMGECWHEDISDENFNCMKCGGMWTPEFGSFFFSTWEGFGKLWSWAKEQKWWDKFEDLIFYGKADPCGGWFDTSLIHPDRFADAVYQFLKERNQ